MAKRNCLYVALVLSVIILEIAACGLLITRFTAYLPAMVLSTAGMTASILALLSSRPTPAPPLSPQYYIYLIQTEKKEPQFFPYVQNRRS